MERLSYNAIDIINELHTERLHYFSEYIPLIDAANRLAEYEDLEEQGKLVILPCKVGETVFIIGSKYRSGKVDKWINTGKFRLSDIEKIGKTVFLTHEEAEEALVGE